MKMPNILFRARAVTGLADRKTLRKFLLKILSTKNGVLGSLGLVSVLVITLIVVFKPIPEKKEVLETAWPVTAIAASPQQYAPELSLYGRVESLRQSSLTAAVTAYVEKVSVLEGSWVNQGDLLIQLDPIDASLLVERREADLTEAEANLATLRLKVAENLRILEHERDLDQLAQQRSKRHDQLRQQKSISEETLNAVFSDTNRQAIALSRHEGLVNDANNQLARASATIKRSKSMLKEAEINLRRTQIIAPFSGRVTSVMVSPGELVRPGVVVVEMYDAQTMEVRSQIPARNLAAIKQALDAGEELSAYILIGNEKLNATLTRLSGEVSRGKSSVDGLFRLSRHTYLELGRAVKLLLSLPTIDNTLLVPVQSMYGHDRVFIIADDRLKGVTITRVGELRDENGHLGILIQSSEIRAGVSIVTSQLSNAITGLKVSQARELSNIAATAAAPIDKSS